MKKIRTTILLLLSFISIFGCSKKLTIPYEQYQLSNQLKVVLIPKPDSSMVSVQVYYHAGGIYESPEVLGISHLLEHMMFKSTKNLKAGDYSAQVKSRGGYDNAYTTYDYTSYYNVLPADALETSLKLEAERMAHLKLDSAELESERQVVIEERHNRYNNNPLGFLWEKANEVFFKGHPYGRPIIGYEKTINAINLDTLQKYYQTYYSPRRAVLLVCGNFDKKNTKKLISQYFETIPNKYPNPNDPKLPTRATENNPFTTFYKPVQTTYALSFIPIPATTDPLLPGLMVLEDILFKGNNALLQKELVQKRKLCYNISGGSYIRKYPSTFLLQFIPAPGITPEIVIEAVKEELAKLSDSPDLDKLLKKSQLFTVTEFYKDMQEVKGITETLGWSSMLKDPDFILHLYDRVQNLSKKDLLKALDYLKAQPITTFVLSPPK